ncbi:MAG TPA: ammonium transporter [Acidimicrobiia bacterium]
MRFLRPRRLVVVALFGLLVVVLSASAAGASDPLPPAINGGAGGLGVSTNLLWICVGGALVMFMQGGFALVETGFTRKKNAAHTMGMNVAIFGTAFAAFFVVGYALMFGGYSFPNLFGYDTAVGSGLIGSGNWVLLWKAPLFMSGKASTVAVLAYFFYMAAFMDATATIPTGAMAERWKWNNFVVWGFFCGAIYYPLFGAWTWGGGWLAKLGASANLGHGYVDFAGSGVVHAMGGVAALAGAIVLGPRIGKYRKDGRPQAIPGHNIPMALMGVIILLFGWFGFNGASTLAATDTRFGLIIANTTIAAAFGTVVSMLYVMKRFGKPDPAMFGNGLLAGLVAITAPCAFVAPWAAAVIGSIAAILVVEAVLFIDRHGVDDPVGAVAVHGVNGIWGVIALGLFANGQYGGDWNGTAASGGTKTAGVRGLFYGHGGAGQLGAQLIGAFVLCTVMFGIAYAFFRISDRVMKGGIRSDRDDELAGLDVPEMGMHGYNDENLTGFEHEYVPRGAKSVADKQPG